MIYKISCPALLYYRIERINTQAVHLINIKYFINKDPYLKILCFNSP